MPRTIHAQLRLTHRYVGTYSHLDNWGDAFTFKELRGRVTEAPLGYDDGGVYMMRVIGNKRGDQQEQRQALRDYYTREGCSHDYDCCGCASTHAQVRKTKAGIFSVRVRTSYNY